MFVDIAKIFIKAGDGGDGAVAFHREKYVASGGPDGGDGGRGGNIVFVADTNLSTLADFRYKRKYIAPKGENGKGGRCNGKKADDLIIKPGMPGEAYEVQLELKLLADVGIVGFPNVGKSTLISVVSEAKPIIANYHFTTITPVLGVVRMGDGTSFVMADIPGLIEGAHDGLGLGHQFLRHVERCRLLVHIVDVSGSEGRDPKQDFETINNELKSFDPEIAKRPMIVAGNKCDLTDDETVEDFKKYVEAKGYKFFPIMAAISYQVEPLLKEIQEQLSKLPPIVRYEAEAAPVIPEEEIGKQKVTVTHHDGVYFVEGEWLLRLLRTINFDDSESLQYFQRVLISSGVIDALKEAGINEGDTVSMYDLEFDFVE